MKAGIYKITCTANGKSYIGSSVNIKQRFSEHVIALNKNSHHSIKLQRAWNKYGENAFSFFTILVCAKSDLLFYEQIILDFYFAVKDGYNICPTAGSCLGVKKSPESIKKTADKLRGRKASEQTKLKMSLARTGRVTSDETKAKLSKIHKGRIISQEQRDKISGTLTGHVSPKRGTKLPDNVKAKISEKLKGRKIPDEAKKNMAKALIGRLVSDATRKKIAESNRKTQEERRSLGLGRSGSAKQFSQAGVQ